MKSTRHVALVLVLFGGYIPNAVFAGTLSSSTASTSNAQINATATYTFSFTTQTVVPSSGAIFEVGFPSGLGGLPVNGSEICSRTTILINSVDRGCDLASTPLTPDTLFIQTTMGSVSAGSVVSVAITGIINPATAGTVTFTHFQTASGPNVAIDTPLVAPTVNITSPNRAPTDITLSNNVIQQDAGSGSVIGSFSTTDVDSTVFTYTLMDGAGSNDNNRFSLSANQLLLKDALAVGAYSIRLRSSDNQGLFFEKVFQIMVQLAGADLDGDGLGNAVDTDDDGDGMPDDWEAAFGLNPLDGRDSTTDTDGDGQFNLEEFKANTKPNKDDYPPVFESRPPVVINATGLFTALPENITPVATDGKDGRVATTLRGELRNLPPGRHVLTFQATDAAGNLADIEQTVDIWPLVSLSGDDRIAEGARSRFSIVLNGPAPEYPYIVAYTVSGTATPDIDHDLSGGVVTFAQDTVVSEVSFDVRDDSKAEQDESVVVSLDGQVNAGMKNTLTATIVHTNIAPQIALIATQDGERRLLVSHAGGPLDIVANVTDANSADTHTLTWITPRGAIATSSSDGLRMSVIPTSLTEGVHRIAVTVMDNGVSTLSTSGEVWLNVVANLPELGATDSDGDGLSDNTEGYQDGDADGIADYLDAIDLSNVLPADAKQSNDYLLETEAGLILTLGEHALRFGADDSGLTRAEAQSMAGVDSVLNIGGYFDFVVRGLPIVGASVKVVIPQRAPISTDAVFRKYDARTGWSSFVENDRNRLSSARGAPGFCPPPGHPDYTAGLTSGHRCVQLSIQDGGPNDTDGTANGSVSDPGGVGSLVSDSVITVTGSGTTSVGALLIVALLGAWRRFPRVFSLAFGILLTILNPAQAQQTQQGPTESTSFVFSGGSSKTADVIYKQNRGSPWYLAGSAIPVNVTEKSRKLKDASIVVPDRLSAQPVATDFSPWYLGGAAVRVGAAPSVTRLKSSSTLNPPVYESAVYTSLAAHAVDISPEQIRERKTTPRHTTPSSSPGSPWYIAGSYSSVNSGTDRGPIDAYIDQQRDSVEVSVDGARAGYHFAFGYNIDRRLGVEIGYADLGEVKVTASGRPRDPQALASVVLENTPTTGNALTFGATFKYWLNRPVALAFRGGVLSLESQKEFSGSSTVNVRGSRDTGAYLGGGLYWRVTPNFGLGASYQRLYTGYEGLNIFDATFQWQPSR